MKTIMELKINYNSCMQGLANKTKDGDCGLLASKMNHFPWLNTNREMFTGNEELKESFRER